MLGVYYYFFANKIHIVAHGFALIFNRIQFNSLWISNSMRVRRHAYTNLWLHWKLSHHEAKIVITGDKERYYSDTASAVSVDKIEHAASLVLCVVGAVHVYLVYVITCVDFGGN